MSTPKDAIDSKMFGKDWWMQPLPARYASLDAHRAGLLVQVELVEVESGREACITWRGTSTQFKATKTFPKGVCAKLRTGRWVHPDRLRGTVYPDGDDCFLFVIEHCNYHGTAYPRRHKEQALTDPSYRRFRDSLLAGCLVDDETKAQS